MRRTALFPGSGSGSKPWASTAARSIAAALREEVQAGPRRSSPTVAQLRSESGTPVRHHPGRRASSPTTQAASAAARDLSVAGSMPARALEAALRRAVVALQDARRQLGRKDEALGVMASRLALAEVRLGKGRAGDDGLDAGAGAGESTRAAASAGEREGEGAEGVGHAGEHDRGMDPESNPPGRRALQGGASLRKELHQWMVRAREAEARLETAATLGAGRGDGGVDGEAAMGVKGGASKGDVVPTGSSAHDSCAADLRRQLDAERATSARLHTECQALRIMVQRYIHRGRDRKEDDKE